MGTQPEPIERKELIKIVQQGYYIVSRFSPDVDIWGFQNHMLLYDSRYDRIVAKYDEVGDGL